jgi:glucosamine-6-phosphate deaminase
VKFDPGNVHLFRGDTPDLEAQAQQIEDRILAVGGIDLQVLGIGRNGHVGFNEPGSSLGSRTRPKTLEPDTLSHYAKAGRELPNLAITMGVGTIMEAKRLLMLASGPDKAEIICRMVEGPIMSEVPATALQMHRLATVVLDEGSASKLRRRDYYKWVFENKWRVGQK